MSNDRRKKLTPKQRVLRKYPQARTGWEIGVRPFYRMTPVVHIDEMRVLGRGLTFNAAWADAARKIK